jgi:low temperature requirement protein LtrA
MADDLTWTGLVRGFAVLAVVWWAWAGYSWLTNSIQIDSDLASRLVMLIALGAMLVVGLAAPGAFGAYSILFGAAYFMVRLLHIGLYAVATRSDPAVFGAVLRLTPGMVAAPLLILISGFVPEGPWRALLWAVAIVIDFGSPLVAGPSGWRIDPGHFAERYGLIIIIALGESLVALGVSAAGEVLTTGVIVAASLGAVVVSAMWWLYFDVVALLGERRLESTTGDARTTMARDSYTYIHLFMVWGILLVALGLKKTLLGIDEPLYPVAAVALFGGVAVYLLAHVAFRLRNVHTVSVRRLIVALLMLALVPVGWTVSSLTSLVILTALLVGLVLYEAWRFREARQAVRHESSH